MRGSNDLDGALDAANHGAELLEDKVSSVRALDRLKEFSERLGPHSRCRPTAATTAHPNTSEGPSPRRGHVPLQRLRDLVLHLVEVTGFDRVVDFDGAVMVAVDHSESMQDRHVARKSQEGVLLLGGDPG